MAGSEWPADKVERRSVASLIPYAKNARTHSEQQVGQIAASIKEWGWTVPILVDEAGGIIAGHGRVLAARSLGIAEVPVMVASGWSDAQKRAYVLADNKLALNAGWDDALLGLELGELRDADFDLSLIGFSEDELARLTIEKTHPDDVPEVPVNPVTVLGDVWILGKHRIICGDSTSAGAIGRLMNGDLADLLFTSPPYAQQRDYGAAAKASVSDWDALMQGAFSVAPMKTGAQLLINLGLVHRDGEWIPYWDGWIEWMRCAGWRRFGWYVWDKLAAVPGDWQGRLAPSHEWIFHFNRDSLKPNKTKEKKAASIEFNSHGSGLRGKDGKMSGVSNRAASLQTHKIPDSVFRVVPHKARGGANAHHPAMFPVALAEEVIGAYSNEGDVVFEPFCGSGTQIIAAEKMARQCFGIDIDPAYVDVAVKRWQAFTGKEATLEGAGRTFNQISADRLKAAA